ncbi:ribosomal protein L2 [Viridothelium virens]|uniref:Large ribosomal subunit protein uL2m n=1 Tax=Viridothelium virens TaxID=1048519 RepID=A0A6A6H9U2_VIRVR|nr:ribosomal protein L2 [Viridothelium virens]
MLQSQLFWRSVATSSRHTCLPCLIRQYATKVEPVSTTPPSSPIQPTVATSDTSTKALQTDGTPQPTQPATSSRRQETAFALRTYKPRTPGVRHLRRPINDHLWKGGPYRPLTFPKIGQGKGGRNNRGRVTVRHRGGGHRRRIRTVDYKREAPGPHTVLRIEYDPNRSSHLALLENNQTKAKSYIIAADGLREGDVVESFRAGIPQKLLDEMGGMPDPGMLAVRTALRGNCLPIRMAPMGSQVFNIGSAVNRGGVFCRSAGTYATVISKTERPKTKKEENANESNSSAAIAEPEQEKSKDGKPLSTSTANPDSPNTSNATGPPHSTGRAVPSTTTKPTAVARKNRKKGEFLDVIIRLQSGELRKVSPDACCTFGVASNPHWHFRQLGKAGRARWLNKRPSVRGMAMNAADHPHGGGRGKSKGNRPPVSPWGTPAKSGYKTRKKRNTHVWLVQDRERNQGKRRSKNA